VSARVRAKPKVRALSHVDIVRSPKLTPEVALGHALYEVRAFLLTRCTAYPQAPRLARVVERAADVLCPADAKKEPPHR
jgi:hypothetical protein